MINRTSVDWTETSNLDAAQLLHTIMIPAPANTDVCEDVKIATSNGALPHSGAYVLFLACCLRDVYSYIMRLLRTRLQIRTALPLDLSRIDHGHDNDSCIAIQVTTYCA